MRNKTTLCSCRAVLLLLFILPTQARAYAECRAARSARKETAEALA